MGGSKNRKTLPSVSIIIRAFNEEKHIGTLLKSVFDQDYPGEIEVVLVDSGSTDKTLEVADNYRVKVVRIKPEEFSFGRSLNRGIGASRGEILVFVSAHCYPEDRDWIGNLIAPFRNKKIGLVYGRQRGNQLTKFSEHRVFREAFPDDSNGVQDDPFCNNANCAIRRFLWEKFPYDEELTGLEDLDWARKILRARYLLSYRADAGVIHIHEESWPQVFRRYEREALASKIIFPELRRSFLDFLNGFLRSVLSDYAAVIRVGLKLKDTWEIFLFRLIQFWGNYRGLNYSGPVPPDLERGFYYPRLKQDNGTVAVPQMKDLKISDFVSIRSRSEKLNSLSDLKGIPLGELVVVFVPSNDTHVKTCHSIAEHIPNSKFLTLSLKGEGAERMLSEFETDWETYTSRRLADLGPDVVVFSNDWGLIERTAVAEIRSLGIPTVCLQEGPLDFADASPYRMRWTDFVFVQGPIMMDFLDREIYFITGNPRFDSIKKMRTPGEPLAMVNLNFTYGVEEEHSDRWVGEVVQSCRDLGLEFFISRHPRDRHEFPGLPVVESGPGVVRGQLARSSVLITRFSTLIYEAVLMGRDVVYYNPHGEDMQMFGGEETGGIVRVYDRDYLDRSLSGLADGFSNDKGRDKFVRLHCTSDDGKSSERCAEALSLIPGVYKNYKPRDMEAERINLLRLKGLVIKFRQNLPI